LEVVPSALQEHEADDSVIASWTEAMQALSPVFAAAVTGGFVYLAGTRHVKGDHERLQAEIGERREIRREQAAEVPSLKRESAYLDLIAALSDLRVCTSETELKPALAAYNAARGRVGLYGSPEAIEWLAENDRPWMSSDLPLHRATLSLSMRAAQETEDFIRAVVMAPPSDSTR
jgi:hypothetical protein